MKDNVAAVLRFLTAHTTESDLLGKILRLEEVSTLG